MGSITIYNACCMLCIIWCSCMHNNAIIDAVDIIVIYRPPEMIEHYRQIIMQETLVIDFKFG